MTEPAQRLIAGTTFVHNLVEVAFARKGIMAWQSAGVICVYHARRTVWSVKVCSENVCLVLMGSLVKNVTWTVPQDVQNVLQLYMGLTQANALNVCLGCMESHQIVYSTVVTAYKDFVQPTAVC